jgi:hypothetical protein
MHMHMSMWEKKRNAKVRGPKMEDEIPTRPGSYNMLFRLAFFLCMSVDVTPHGWNVIQQRPLKFSAATRMDGLCLWWYMVVQYRRICMERASSSFEKKVWRRFPPMKICPRASGDDFVDCRLYSILRPFMTSHLGIILFHKSYSTLHVVWYVQEVLYVNHGCGSCVVVDGGTHP